MVMKHLAANGCAALRNGAPAPCVQSGVVGFAGMSPLIRSNEAARRRRPPDDLDVLRGGPPASGRPRPARSSPAPSARSSRRRRRPPTAASSRSLYQVAPSPRSTWAPALTHCPIGAAGAAAAAPTPLSSPASTIAAPRLSRTDPPAAGPGRAPVSSDECYSHRHGRALSESPRD